MTPGRELDALIAEKVMGYTRGVDSFTLTSYRTPQYPNGVPVEQDVLRPHDPDSGPDLCLEDEFWSVTPYSTDIAAAWTVVEKIKTLKIEGVFLIEYTPHNKNKQWACGWDNYGDFNGSFGMTPPLAICLAALKAVGVDPDSANQPQ